MSESSVITIDLEKRPKERGVVKVSFKHYREVPIYLSANILIQGPSINLSALSPIDKDTLKFKDDLEDK